mmetsp:Transcript_74367/g.231842  ORF Transcript_74367/g.231842 Transcript_74367/m.231842 type:complete len:442 (+) Transcript_74367:102-1427(+)
MSVLQAAGSTLMHSQSSSQSLRLKSPPLASTLGVRSLREEYLKAVHKNSIPSHMKHIEERLMQEGSLHETVASEERTELPRFKRLFANGDLMPPGLFIAALELSSNETLNGRTLAYDGDVLLLRDNLVMAYKPLVLKIRQLNAREIDELPIRLVVNFSRAWTAFESTWLRNREVHAVEALQPLAKAILSLEPLLLSAEKERLLPWPRVQHQKAVTLKCLQGFVHSFAELAGCVLPSLQRELDHDPRLLLLMDHVLSLRGDKSVNSCLDGLSSAPEVNFPDHQAAKTVGSPPGTLPGMQASGALRDGKGVTLDTYAFKLLGASVGDAVAAGKLHSASGNGQAGRAKMAVSLGTDSVDMKVLNSIARPRDARETELSRRAAKHASELLSAFEGVKDVLLALKSTLEELDPALDRDEVFVSSLLRFERAFKVAKRLFLEPDNLA